MSKKANFLVILEMAGYIMEIHRFCVLSQYINR